MPGPGPTADVLNAAPHSQNRSMGIVYAAFGWPVVFAVVRAWGRRDQSTAAKRVSLIHAASTLGAAMLYVARRGTGPVRADAWGTEPLADAICDYSAGYMLYDLVHVFTLKEHRMFLAHHVLSAVGLQSHRIVGAGSIVGVHNLLAAELGGLLFQLSRQYPRNPFYRVAFPLSMVATRLLYFPLISYWHMLRIRKMRPTAPELARLAGTVAAQGGVIAVNIGWLLKLVRTGRVL